MSRIVRIIALVFSITSTIIFALMLYTAWWRLAERALFNLIFCMPLVAIVMRLFFRSNPKSSQINPSEKVEMLCLTLREMGWSTKALEECGKKTAPP